MARSVDEWNDSLRRSAIWYPEIPRPTTSVNEEFYVPLKSSTWRYKPIFWSNFGGPGGICLPHLTKVTGTLWGEAWMRMDFSFDIDVPPECQRFGRCEDFENSELIEFLVDGPGGEVIEKVEIWHHFPREISGNPAWVRREGILDMVKLTTNRGRTCEFGTRFSQGGRFYEVTRELSAVPGMAITGFFGCQV